MNTHALSRIGIALLIASVAGATIAAEPKAKDADLLRGPKVAESSSAQSKDTMTGSAKAKKKAGELPFNAFINAVHNLRRAAKDNPELALSEKQLDEIKAIRKAHQEKMQAFMEEHRDEFMELNRYNPDIGQEGDNAQRRAKRGGDRAGKKGQERAQDERGARGAPPSSDKFEEGTVEAELDKRPPLSRAEMKQNRKKLAKLMELAPSDTEARMQVWTVLSPDQKASVKEHISKVRAQRSHRSSMALGRGARKANPDAQERERKKKPQRVKHVKEDDED